LMDSAFIQAISIAPIRVD